MEIIDEQKIFDVLSGAEEKPSMGLISDILGKACEKQGLTLEDAATLLNAHGEQLVEIFRAAGKVKDEVYGNRLVLFAPLYLSNYCVNDCAYCGFHRSNPAQRKKLSPHEIRAETEALIKMGHKRVLIEVGEDPVNNSIDYVVGAIKEIYSVKYGRGEIRRINVNIAATTVENYERLKNARIGTYQLFQETYHRETYAKLHNGPKADFERQITAMDRALQAGIDDVGIGVLFGLYDYKFEVLALISHAQYLDSKYGIGPHTISVPRWRPAETVSYTPEYPVSDEDFLKLIAVLRLAVPYTGMILSTRETPTLRHRAWGIGISQTSAASVTSPGGYAKGPDGAAQFEIHDNRSLDEVVQSMCRIGYMPSFCTACYRSGRTGEEFMALAKSSKVHLLCHPNAILTFKEYLLDYASPETRKIGEKFLEKELAKIEDEEQRRETERRLRRIEEGERDVYF